jgi:hypothetical protein
MLKIDMAKKIDNTILDFFKMIRSRRFVKANVLSDLFKNKIGINMIVTRLLYAKTYKIKEYKEYIEEWHKGARKKALFAMALYAKNVFRLVAVKANRVPMNKVSTIKR